MKNKFFTSFLAYVEKIGNTLPSPVIIFIILSAITILLSYFLSFFNIVAINPSNGENIQIFNLFSLNGLNSVLINTVKNFTNFAPFGIVLVALMGIGVAEHSGLISSVLKLVVHLTPNRMLTFVLVFCGVISNVASDVGYVLLIPLGAVVFHAVGRHPIAGIAATFAGVSGGFSANIMLGTIDPLLAGLSQEAARIIDPTYIVSPVANYYFMFCSTFLISILGTIITEKLIIPKLGLYENIDANPCLEKLNKHEKKGLLFAGSIFVIFVLIIILGLVPEQGFLRSSAGKIIDSNFIKGIIVLVFLFGTMLGLFYGIGAKTIKSSKDFVNAMVTNMNTMGSYIVLTFFAAQFIALFKESNIAVITAITGANWLKSLTLGAPLTMILFILMCSLFNLIIGSCSAKWALLAPIFVPMFMILGYSPELIQAAYRIGDSSTSIISPMMSYFPLVIVYFEKYDKKAGIGTVFSTMLPYSLVFLVAWSIFLIIWLNLGFPVGPGANLFLR